MCGKTGYLVPSQTVEKLVGNLEPGVFKLEIFSLCMDQACEMAYFSADYGYLYLQRQIKVPLDYKEDADKKYACYCHEITLDALRHAVLKEGASSVKDVLKKKPVIVSQCQSNNPFGCSCLADMNKRIEEIKLGLSGEL
ncbi:(2Fe-2S)-binding protein [Acidaminobacter sp. JC074]|uniref:(2Fe-2S)-binding protein n=1 Tax=Acidaminobacter sp. JC074 TaxID=2530199 RepID=UPI001F0D8112|nr:(2Fe-2S)-binding protein [Acidaminobacter sp. JC074]MCH4890058.1 (2Fe-2S)-binding protein [Acidaminobacter sp. JC074]